MKISSEQIENSQVALNVEMEGIETDKYMEQALEHLSREVTLPGFRKGKAPRSLVEQHVGKQAIFQEALEHLIPEAYEEALKMESIAAIADPKIELLKIDPVIFKAIVPVQPAVTLGNYKDLRLKPEKKDITDKEIDEVIEQLRLQMGSLEPVERNIQFDDIVSIDIEGKKDEETLIDRKGVLHEVRKESNYPVPGFSEHLVDLKKSDETEFSITFPADYEIKDLAEKEAHFKVKINEIKVKVLPEVNDEFAKNAGGESVPDLREKIKSGLQTRADDQAHRIFENKLMSSLIEQTTIEFPPVLVEKEIDNLISEEARNFSDGVKGLENYLKNIKKTYDEHREELKTTATERVKAYLIINKIAEVENINATDEELNQTVEKMAKGDEKKLAELNNLLSLPQTQASLRDMIVVNKTMEFITNIVTSSEE
ncbi:MAG: trigger factor [Dehalococcoidia bacterium]|nr:trigger factor [Dehalococcoidia bacterium]MDD5493091.1 trigger factor [Dehalococcoidia bacterium]